MEIVIKNKIDRPVSVYKVVLTYMHGDGDATTHEEFFYKNLDEFKEVLIVLIDLKEVNNSEKYGEILEKKGLEWDSWCHFFIGDATSPDYTALIEDVKVTYYDEIGNEYTTDIKK
jgi:hypothetical protein